MYVRLNRCLLHRLDCLQGRENEHTPYIQFKKAGAVYKMVPAPVETNIHPLYSLRRLRQHIEKVRALIEHPVLGPQRTLGRNPEI